MRPPESDLKSLFLEALDRPAGPERAAYLDLACRGDASLRAGLEGLLEAHDRAGSFLGPPVEAATTAAGRDSTTAAEADAPPPSTDGAFGPGPGPNGSPASRRIAEGPGSCIGPYRLLEKLGEGGMGVVFLAEQDRPVRRRVALKVIKPGMDTELIVARFEAERQALALMDHPNIARVFDAGSTDSGRPYFVMELVDGVPINEYCDRERLSPRQWLEIFVAACRAIEHAHQKGVIHRDIKPSNVLVTLQDGRAVPKVIDFGVAKAIDRRLNERTLFTQLGALVGTPEYMSPEQADDAGAGIDARSDVYALGVLLYELLTGTTPLGRMRLMEAAFSEILRRIREEEPPKPSTRLSGSGEALASIAACRDVEPSRLTRLVRGELDWITMKALQKDRHRRYPTAMELGRDVQRYLDGDPVEASPPSPLYRAGKLARRHRAALLIAAGMVLVLAGASLVSWRLMHLDRPGERSAASRLSQPRFILKDHKDVAWCVAFAPDGKSMVTCAGNRDTSAGEVRGYDLSSGRPVPMYVVEEPHGIRWAAFAPDGKTLATGEYDGMVRIREAATGKALTRLDAHRGGVQCLKFTRDGRSLVTCGKDRTAKVWDLATRGVKATMTGAAEFVFTLDLSVDEKTLLTGASDASAVLWDVATGGPKANVSDNMGWVEVVRYSPNGTLFAFAGWDKVVNIRGTTTGARIRTLDSPGGGILALAFTPDGKHLVAGTELGVLRVWDTMTWDVLSTIRAHDGNIRAIAFSPDGKSMATAGHDWTVKIWDAP